MQGRISLVLSATGCLLIAATSGAHAACTTTTLTLITDQYASETSWAVTSAASTLASGSGYQNNQTYSSSVCLNDGSYTFTIYDAYGDGICCDYGQGSYQLKAGAVTVASGGEFASQESTAFTIGAVSGGAATIPMATWAAPHQDQVIPEPCSSPSTRSRATWPAPIFTWPPVIRT